MSVIKEEKTVMVEQSGHASGVKAAVTHNGKTGKGSGTGTADNVDEAVAKASEKAKSQSKATGGR
ncbi:MAG: hypothetical protein QOG38_1437 [Hyphomicrobiales bacterium]|jgi:ribosomal protein S5|nr:hypothetical protein [Hyphomicrobiales bacterium]